MIESRFSSLNPHGFHQIAYGDWGNAANPHVVLCFHGLTRNGRDFDYLARTLQSHCRVVCPDVVGRGRSDWLKHKEDYTFRQYQIDAAALIARSTDSHGRSVLPRWARSAPTDADGKVDWVGTSMGGLIGMLVAGQPRAPIRRLVLNDIGPFIPWAALIRLKGYLGGQTRYASLDEVEKALRDACSQWGRSPANSGATSRSTARRDSKTAAGRWLATLQSASPPPGAGIRMRRWAIAG